MIAGRLRGIRHAAFNSVRRLAMECSVVHGTWYGLERKKRREMRRTPVNCQQRSAGANLTPRTSQNSNSSINRNNILYD